MFIFFFTELFILNQTSQIMNTSDHLKSCGHVLKLDIPEIYKEAICIPYCLIAIDK